MFKHLAANPMNSIGRLYIEDEIDLRNPFERDRARISEGRGDRPSDADHRFPAIS